MRIIHKSQLDVGKEIRELSLPEDAKIHHVGIQHDEVTFWYSYCNKKEVVTRNFCVVGTGWEFQENTHIHGTCIDGVGYVWHLVEVLDDPSQ